MCLYVQLTTRFQKWILTGCFSPQCRERWRQALLHTGLSCFLDACMPCQSACLHPGYSAILIQLPADVLGKQQLMAQVLEFLPFTKEMWMEVKSVKSGRHRKLIISSAREKALLRCWGRCVILASHSEMKQIT